ncbi:MAG TPA: hypothetical protein VFG77_06560, partial [Nitrososphaeraceae archaeon]|nr:hypothetical protein [Nitrososphaeraceae archaeon]
MIGKGKILDPTVSTLVNGKLLRPKIVWLFALSFVLVIVLALLVLPSVGERNSYATSASSNGTTNGEPQPGTTNGEPQPGTITVTKRVVNEGGGTARPSDFTITVDGNNPTPPSFDGSSSGTTVQLFEGRYSVTESGSATSDYDSTLSRGCSGSIREGETKSCTITNTYSVSPPPITTGQIVVTKRVINEGGGTARPSDFTITVDGNNPTPSSFDGSSSGTTVTLEPGRYSVTENSLPDYTSSSSDDCTGTVQAGETKECTITNEYQTKDRSAQLIVIKNVVNTPEEDSDLVLKPSAFTIVVQGNDPLPRSFPGKSGEGVVVNLNAGRYSIFEKEVDGY